MELTITIVFAVACSTVMSIVAFMVGRCGRKLPIDGMLPRVVHSARFSPEKDRPPYAPEPSEPRLAPGRLEIEFSAPPAAAGSHG
jgi:hypothetical protein